MTNVHMKCMICCTSNDDKLASGLNLSHHRINLAFWKFWNQMKRQHRWILFAVCLPAYPTLHEQRKLFDFSINLKLIVLKVSSSFPPR